MMRTAERDRRVVCLGECMVELHKYGSGLYRQTYGGDTLNTAAYIARLGEAKGVLVDYLTGVGADSVSEGMLDFFRRLGVGVSHVRRVENRMPGLYMIEVDAHGERCFHYWRNEAAARFCLDQTSPEELCAELSSFGHVYLSGISLAILTPKGRETLLASLKSLKKAGTHISFDSNYRPRLWPDAGQAAEAFRQILPLCGTAILTADDMRSLFSLPDDDKILELCMDRGVAEVVLKRGASPCIVSLGGRRIEVPAKTGVPVVDTTAAGDSFNAAYLTARILGHGPEFSARCGHELAAAVIQHHGAIIEAKDIPANILQENAPCA